MAIRLLFLGDSIAAETTIGFVPIAVRGVSQAFNVSTDSINSSVPSSNVLDLVDRTQELLPTQSQSFTAACIFVGVNDSKILAQFHEALVPIDLFRRRLHMLAQRLESTGALLVLCGLPDLHFSKIQQNGALKEFWYWVPDDYHQYNDAIREVAQEGEARAFVDLDKVFKAYPQGIDPLFGPDGVHPSAQGHSVIADAVSTALVELLKSMHR